MSKRFNLDLSKFKKVKSDKKSTTLRHEQGHEIILNHAALEPAMRGQLAELDLHKGDGGEVEDDFYEKSTKNLESAGAKEDEPQEEIKAEPVRVIDEDKSQNYAEGGVTGSTGSQGSDDKDKKKTLGQIIGYPGMAKGGKVAHYAEGTPKAPVQEEDAVPIDVSSTPNIPADLARTSSTEVPEGTPQTMTAEQQMASNLPFGIPDEELAPLAQKQAENAAPSEMPSGAPQAPKNVGTPFPENKPFEAPSYEHAYSQIAGSIMGSAKAAQDQAEAEQRILETSIRGQQAAQKEFNTHLNNLSTEYNHFVQDIKDSHIDPQHYWNSMDTVGKVGTAIGLILGGMGAGITGGENPVFKMLNMQIDRDIAAQKADLGKKESLLSANFRQFGNLRDATQMTAAMQRGIIADQLRAAALKTSNPMIQAAAQKAAGEFEMQNVIPFQQMAMRRALMASMKAGQEVDPAQVVALLPDASPAEKKEMYKEINNAQETNKLRADMQDSYNDLSKQFMNGLLSPRDRASALEAFAGRLAKVSEGRFNLEAAKIQADSILPGPGDFPSTVKKKQQRLNALFDTMINAPVSMGHQLDLNKFKSTSGNAEGRLTPQQQSFLQWARQNPGDPRAKIILQKLGIQ